MSGRRFWIVLVAAIAVLVGCNRGPAGRPEAKNRLDPLLLDFVAPVDGDDWLAASMHFQVGLAQARAEAIAPCLRERGFPGQESALVTEARYEARINDASLPALDQYAGNGISHARPSELTDDLSSAMMYCGENDRSDASGWKTSSLDLLGEFRQIVEERLALMESEQGWHDAEACMTDAGAPPFSDGLPDLPEIPADAKSTAPGYQFYVNWVQSIEIQMILGQNTGPPGASEESRALARCLTPFFEEVERSLERPREEFVEEHREELVELQRQFASFDVAEG
jgi:hypothetical protein